MRTTWKRLAIAISAAGLALSPVFASAQDFPLSPDEIRLLFRSPTVGGDIVVAKDVESILAFGGSLTVKDTTAETVASMTGTTTVLDSTLETLATASGTISIIDSTIGELALAAGSITLNGGTVSGDAMLAGGEVIMTETTTIGGDLAIHAGVMNLATNVGGDLRATGDSITLAGSIGGDAKLTAVTIKLEPGTTIGGDLLYTSSSELTLPEGVTVGGEVHRLGGDGDGDSIPDVEYSISISEIFGGGLTGWFLGLMTLGICGAVALALAPVVMNSAGQIVEKEPLPSFGVGVAFLIGVPVATVLIGMTLIGIPLAILLGAAYLITLGLGLFAVCMWGSDRIRQATNQSSVNMPAAKRIGWALLAFVIFVAAGSIPVAGAIVQFLALVIGSGAVILAAWARRKMSAAEKPVSP